MLLRKKPLEWVDLRTTNGLYEMIPRMLKDGYQLWSQEDCLGQFPSIEAAKEAAEEHWATVVPPGCELVELCPSCCTWEDPHYCGYECEECHCEGVVEVEAKP